MRGPCCLLLEDSPTSRTVPGTWQCIGEHLLNEPTNGEKALRTATRWWLWGQLGWGSETAALHAGEGCWASYLASPVTVSSPNYKHEADNDNVQLHLSPVPPTGDKSPHPFVFLDMASLKRPHSFSSLHFSS